VISLLLGAGVLHGGPATPSSAGAESSCLADFGETRFPPNGWFTLDELIWWTRGASLPPLVTSAPPSSNVSDSGALASPATTVLFGDERIGDTMRNGFRLDAGIWLDAEKTVGLGLDFFALESSSALFRGPLDDHEILARPFTDATTGRAEAELVNYPGFVRGQVQVDAVSPGLWGWGLALRECVGCCRDHCGRAGTRTDWILGYRHLRLDDRVRISEQLASPIFIAGTELAVEDHFTTQNAFHGVELGLSRTEWFRRWELDYSARLALGWNASSTRIHGRTTVESPGFDPVIHEGGLLALGTNAGRFDDDDFTAVFQIGTNLAYRLTDRILVRVGYSLFYWPDVFRAGDQIDTTINPNLLPPPLEQTTGPDRPAARLRDCDFWAQGLNLGVEYRF
jgi:hypothetical protein